MTLRYVPAIESYGALRRGRDMAMFDEHDEEEDMVGTTRLAPFVQGIIYRRLFSLDTKPHFSISSWSPVPSSSRSIPSCLRQSKTEGGSISPKANITKTWRIYPATSVVTKEILNSYGLPPGSLTGFKKAFDREEWPADDESLATAFSCRTRRQIQNRPTSLGTLERVIKPLEAYGESNGNTRAKCETSSYHPHCVWDS